MFISFYSIFEFTLLILNGFAIINRERVLNKFLNRQHTFNNESENSVLLRLVYLIQSIQIVLRVPLIAANSIFIIFKLIFG